MPMRRNTECSILQEMHLDKRRSIEDVYGNQEWCKAVVDSLS